MLRMKGSIQSYELYDSTKYEKVRTMLDILEKERLEDYYRKTSEINQKRIKNSKVKEVFYIKKEKLR
jgi:hypothetical protein